MINTINEKACPFCKEDNVCMAKSETPCWCNNVQIPTQLIDLVPLHLKRKSCICLSCINSYNTNPEIFKSRFTEKFADSDL